MLNHSSASPSPAHSTGPLLFLLLQQRDDGCLLFPGKPLLQLHAISARRGGDPSPPGDWCQGQGGGMGERGDGNELPMPGSHPPTLTRLWRAVSWSRWDLPGVRYGEHLSIWTTASTSPFVYHRRSLSIVSGRSWVPRQRGTQVSTFRKVFLMCMIWGSTCTPPKGSAPSGRQWAQEVERVGW